MIVYPTSSYYLFFHHGSIGSMWKPSNRVACRQEGNERRVDSERKAERDAKVRWEGKKIALEMGDRLQLYRAQDGGLLQRLKVLIAVSTAAPSGSQCCVLCASRPLVAMLQVVSHVCTAGHPCHLLRATCLARSIAVCHCRRRLRCQIRPWKGPLPYGPNIMLNPVKLE